MNKKGQMGIAIMASVVIFIVGMLFLNFLMPEVTTFRTDMNCDSPDDISDGTKLLCLAGDSIIPYFILLVLSVTIGVITERVIL